MKSSKDGVLESCVEKPDEEHVQKKTPLLTLLLICLEGRAQSYFGKRLGCGSPQRRCSNASFANLEPATGLHGVDHSGIDSA